MQSLSEHGPLEPVLSYFCRYAPSLVPDFSTTLTFNLASFALENQKAEAKTVFDKLIEKYPKTPAASAAKNQLTRFN